MLLQNSFFVHLKHLKKRERSQDQWFLNGILSLPLPLFLSNRRGGHRKGSLIDRSVVWLWKLGFKKYPCARKRRGRLSLSLSSSHFFWREVWSFSERNFISLSLSLCYPFFLFPFFLLDGKKGQRENSLETKLNFSPLSSFWNQFGRQGEV